MEIFYEEITKGPLNFEVSVYDESEVDATPGCSATPPFHVMLTARDEATRMIWSTPVMSTDGSLKSYPSVEEALQDAKKKIH